MYYGRQHLSERDVNLIFNEQVEEAIADSWTPSYVWAWSFVQNYKHLFKVNVGDTEYSADTELDLYANEDGMGFFLETINPNIEKTGNIVFELPKQVKNPKLEVSSGFGWAGGQSPSSGRPSGRRRRKASM